MMRFTTMRRGVAVRLIAVGFAGAAAAGSVRADEPALSCEMQTPIRLNNVLPVQFILTSNRDGTRIFEDWNSWGYYCRYFTAVTPGGKAPLYHLARRARGWRGNAPTTLVLNRGQKLTTEFDLADGSWEADPALHLASDSDMLVTPHFRVEAPERDLDFPGVRTVWVGHIQGPAVRVEFSRGAINALNVD